MTSLALTATDIRFAYNARSITLHVPSFAAAPGVHHIIGLNGSGKSIFVKILSVVLKPRYGEVTYRDREIRSAQGLRDYGRGSGYLWQNFQLRGSTPVPVYLEYRAWLHGLETSVIAEAAAVALERVGLADRANAGIGRMFGGQQRRMGIAAETLHRPGVLLLDEPCSGLDYQAKDLVYDAIDQMVDDAAIVVTVAHEPEEVARRDATVHVMSAGRMIISATFQAGELTAAALRDLTGSVSA